MVDFWNGVHCASYYQQRLFVAIRSRCVSTVRQHLQMSLFSVPLLSPSLSLPLSVSLCRSLLFSAGQPRGAQLLRLTPRSHPTSIPTHTRSRDLQDSLHRAKPFLPTCISKIRSDSAALFSTSIISGPASSELKTKEKEAQSICSGSGRTPSLITNTGMTPALITWNPFERDASVNEL